MNENHAHLARRDIWIKSPCAADKIVEFCQRLDSSKSSTRHDKCQELAPLGRVGLQIGVFELINDVCMESSRVRQALNGQRVFGNARQTDNGKTWVLRGAVAAIGIGALPFLVNSLAGLLGLPEIGFSFK